MKKILFATTALIATTGMAAAEIKLGGSARFGLAYNEGNAEETRVEQRFRVNIDGITESDAGVKFEVRFRLESNEDENSAIAGRGPGAARFSVSTGGFRLDLGNTSDVIDSGDVVDYFGYGVGLTSFIEQSNNGDLDLVGFGAGDQDQTTVKARYTAGDFTVSGSYSDERVGDVQQYQLGASYNFGNYTVGAAFGNTDSGATDEDFWAASFNGEIGAVAFSVLATDSDGQDDVTFGASLNYALSSATDLRFAISDGGADANETSFGVGFRHSLGGGVSLRGGVGQDADENTVADLGVALSF
ncbi:outer membrane protein OmpU [Epibacterium ulvae]|uniref:Outer membrane protein OmpU n=1 Tax=Epibacterium ulvae TaxID=1156985 RepID=A0A1G5QYP2_9RHOB|nr:porin [Epibacterium ulvae]SCZ66361.1 outer membrane protein OmpU [Epibacterium ulvae]